MAAPSRTRFFRSFTRMLVLFVEEARGLVVNDCVDLAGLIERYLDPLDFVDLEFQRYKTQALVLYLLCTRILIGFSWLGQLEGGRPSRSD
ncbi:hypothetical protein JCGZ_15222 [Jatropha curcas]|uniref:Uncharacterized protein n=1 Tax=Jatropha curcas TaxID=180498 RepID=A0A067K610_JATCU|nr:hypothetical protein JCGZ_15222 [Jatropha curcas]